MFNDKSKQDWIDKINKDLGDKKYDELKIKNKENIVVEPVYHHNNNINRYPIKMPKKWIAYQYIEVESVDKANKEALNAIKNKMTGICFSNPKNLNKLLRNINLKNIRIDFSNYDNKFLEELNGFKNKINGSLHGYENSKLTNTIFIKKNKSFKKQINELLIDRSYKNSVQINIEIGADYFLEIAKLKAVRLIWENKYKSNAFIFAHIPYDKKITHHKNIILNTTKYMSAIFGGANAIMISSNKKENKTYGSISKIISEQQLIIKEESDISRVIDPTKGSYYIDFLICELLSKIKFNARDCEIKQSNNKYLISPENIKIKNNYTKEDIKNLFHLKYIAGEPPFLRGPYSSMYTVRPWTIRQYAGFSTAEKSNDFYRKNLRAGQKGLSVAFDLATHRGYDSDHERVTGDVGMSGVAVDSIEDMKILFHKIPLDKISVSMTMNGAVLPILAFYIVTAKEQGVNLKDLSGTIQNDILKEFMVRNTYIYPPKFSMRIVSDIFKYTAKNMPKFNPISVSGYHMQEAGATADLELAYTLANGLAYLKSGVNAGIDIDDFAPRISFFWGIGMNHFMEIAKMRAARIIWARIVKDFSPKNPKSMALRTHCQTSGWSLTAQSPFNNITRTTVEAMSAIIGGTQSLHTNALDEAIALPTEFSAKIARDTQIYLQNEINICNVIDPLGGSFYIEKLTNDLSEKVWNHIKKIEENGGMIKEIERGIPKLEIEKNATKKQARIDNKQDIIIGVNKLISSNNEDGIRTLEINNKNVRNIQINRLNELKNKRNIKKVNLALKKINIACKNDNLNLLDACIYAAKERATLGEISDEISKFCGRYEVQNQAIGGVYKMEINQNKKFQKALVLSDKFADKHGRRARIMIAKMGQDGHDRGAKIIASSFADLGFDVDISPLFQTPDEVVKQLLENDAHILGISSLAAGHKTLVPKVIEKLKQQNRDDILIIVGGVIPKKDYKFLYEIGVDKIFGPGTIISESAIEILKKII